MRDGSPFHDDAKMMRLFHFLDTLNGAVPCAPSRCSISSCLYWPAVVSPWHSCKALHERPQAAHAAVPLILIFADSEGDSALADLSSMGWHRPRSFPRWLSTSSLRQYGLCACAVGPATARDAQRLVAPSTKMHRRPRGLSRRCHLSHMGQLGGHMP